MHFIDQLKGGNRLRKYEALLAEPAKFVEDCSRFVLSAYEVASKTTCPEQKYHHATILLLMRHVAEAVDGVSLLVAKGSAENGGPLLRSAFEALVGLLYILKADSERRSLGYQVAHAQRKIKYYCKCIPTDDVGSNLRAELKDDPLVSVFDWPEIDMQKRIDVLHAMLAKPEYAPIQTEWERIKKERRGGKDPNWFTLFGGPGDLRKLALQIGKGALYEAYYRHWSDFTHAGGALDNISEGEDGAPLIQPIRCPEGIEFACDLAWNICVETSLRACARSMQNAYNYRVFRDFSHRL